MVSLGRSRVRRSWRRFDRWDFLGAVGLVVLGLSSGASAQEPNLVDRLVIGEGGGIQTDPDLARLDAPGRFVVVWSNLDPQTGDSEIAARRVAIPGGSLGPELIVDPGPGVSDPAVTASEDGGFLVVWQRPGTANTTGDFDTALVGRRFDSEGQPLASELQLASTSGRVGDIEVENDASGNFVLAWRSVPEPFEGRIYTARFAADGSPLDEATIVSDPNLNALGHDLAVDPEGSFVVVWNREGGYGNPDEDAIAGRRFAADGTPVGEPFVVKEENSVDRWQSPAVAKGLDGRFVVAWSNEDTVEEETSIRIRQFSAEALPLIGELQVNRGNFADFRTYLEPEVSMVEDGRFVVVWRALGTEGESDIQGKVFAPNASLQDEFLVASFVTTSRRDPHIATGAGSDFVVTWSTDGSDVPGTGYANETDSRILGRAYALPCLDDPVQSCLLAERFQVSVSWRDFAGNEGVASQVPVDSDSSTLLWFFEETNWEMLVKMVDGCDFNGHYWLFAAATTNVETVLTVTDTWSGAVRVYTNPVGQASAAITDVTAFATCD